MPKQSPKPAGTAEVLASIAGMADEDRAIAERVHAIVSAVAPELTPRLWYNMPAWAKGGKVVCFFQSGQKFKTRYSTLGFQPEARLDEGHVWPVAFAVTELDEKDEARIAELVRKALD